MLIQLFKLFVSIKVWVNDKWDSFFNIKEIYAFNTYKIKKLNLFSEKIYKKIMVKYYINNLLKRKIMYNTNVINIKQTLQTETSDNHIIHKPLLYIKILINKKIYDISGIIPYIREYLPETYINDIILFHCFMDVKPIKRKFYKKIYIKTLRKEFIYKFNELKEVNIIDFYKKFNTLPIINS